MVKRYVRVISTTLSTDVYEAFLRACHRVGTRKSVILRDLIVSKIAEIFAGEDVTRLTISLGQSDYAAVCRAARFQGVSPAELITQVAGAIAHSWQGEEPITQDSYDEDDMADEALARLADPEEEPK